MMAGALDGKVAIVTGGGRGLGRAMVLGLAQAGARVVALAARERAESIASPAEAARRRGRAVSRRCHPGERLRRGGR